MSNSSGVQHRIYWLDLARAIAIISVTFNHALSRSFSTRSGTQLEFLQMSRFGSFVKAFLYMFSRIGVPFFLMITGALLLKRNYEERETTRRFLRHNWLGLFRTTEIWYVIMFWYLQVLRDSPLRTEGIGKALLRFLSTLLFINQYTMSSMWYMPMILLVYLMIPVISLGINKIGDRFFLLLFTISILCGMIVPNINTILYAAGSKTTIDLAFTITDLFSLYVIYILAGYWISKRKLEKIGTSLIVICLIISALGTTVFQYWIYSTASDYFLCYADFGILLTGALLFELFRRKAGLLEKAKKPVVFLSRISFGIYFVHICIMSGLYSVLGKVSSIERFPKFFVLETVSFFLSVFIIWITSKNKKIGQYLYLIKE